MPLESTKTSTAAEAVKRTLTYSSSAATARTFSATTTTTATTATTTTTTATGHVGKCFTGTVLIEGFLRSETEN